MRKKTASGIILRVKKYKPDFLIPATFFKAV